MKLQGAKFLKITKMTKALEIEEHLSDVTINQNDEKSNDD